MNTLHNQTEVYLSSKEAGEILGYTHDYISRLCRQGHMVGTQKGREWFVKPSDLEVFKQKHEVILQEKKKQLSQKLSQIRKDHEAQKRVQKQISQKLDNSPVQTITQSVVEKNQDSFKPISKFIIPKQLVAVCILALVLLVPTIVDVISNTPIAPIETKNQTASVIQVSPILNAFTSSISELPLVTFDAIQDIGNMHLAVYQLQGEIIYETLHQISATGNVILSGYQLVGESFVQGTDNVVNAYANMLLPLYQDSMYQTQAYASDVAGGYQYVFSSVFEVSQSLIQTTKDASTLMFANVSENIFEMNQTITSLAHKLNASVGSFIIIQNQKNISEEVIFVE